MANMRISGLASGMDIDSIVSDMLRIKRIPLDKLKQEKQIKEWQRDDYRSINTLLLNFRSDLTQMKLTTQYRTRTTTTTDDARVTATASSAASLSSYSISQVSQLAKAETQVGKILSATENANIAKFDSTKGLYVQKDQFAGSTNFDWDTGAILTKSYNAKKGEASVELKDLTIKDGTLDKLSVKINGVGYKVVTDKALNDLNDNEVLYSGGQLTFKKPLELDSAIKVDYVADNRTDTIGIPKEGNTVKLAQGAIQNVTSIKLNTFIDGKASESNPQITYRVEGNQIFDKEVGGELVGTIDKDTGEITFTDKMPRPNEDTKTTYSLEVTYDHAYTTFNVNTHTSKGERYDSFLISGSESLNSVMNKVNSASVGVNMFYDSFTGQMSLTRKETGDFNTQGNEITTSGGINQLFNLNGASIKEKAQNAKFTINGLETERSSNSFAINGVTFTLKKEFTASETPVTIAINNDSNAVYENIKSFIDKYNELIGKIQGKTQEERYKAYTPLTDEQRESLSDKQQEQWEEKAKSGLLRRDSTLTGLLGTMRMDFYGTVESEGVSSVYNQLAKIGIKTTANYLEGGKLEINEAQLKKAIEEDPESVEKLFNATGDTSAQKGIAQRLYDSVGKTMDVLYEKAGKAYSTNNQFTLGKQLNDLNTRIDSFEDRLIALEDRYYRQFTAMEKAIQKANQQSAYIMNNMFNF